MDPHKPGAKRGPRRLISNLLHGHSSSSAGNYSINVNGEDLDDWCLIDQDSEKGPNDSIFRLEGCASENEIDIGTILDDENSFVLLDHFEEEDIEDTSIITDYEQMMKVDTNNVRNCWQLVCTTPVPEYLRSKVWPMLIGVRTYEREHGESSEELYLQKLEFVFGDSTKFPDMDNPPPTFGTNFGECTTFYQLEPFEKKVLHRILFVVARMNAGLASCPSLLHIACILIKNLSEWDTFFCLHLMLSRSTSSTREYFNKNISLETSSAMTLSRLVRIRHPLIHHHLTSLSSSEPLLAYDHLVHVWFSTFFQNVFVGKEMQTRLMDLYSLGGMKFLYKTALCLIRQVGNVITRAKTISEIDAIVHTVSCQLSVRWFASVAQVRFRNNTIKRLHEETEKDIQYTEAEASENYYFPRPSTQSLLIGEREWCALYRHIPQVLRSKHPLLLYRGSDDGFSLWKLLSKAKAHRYTVIIIKGKCGTVAGAFVTENWTKSPKFYGSRATFVFQVEKRKRKEVNKGGGDLDTAAVYGQQGKKADVKGGEMDTAAVYGRQGKNNGVLNIAEAGGGTEPRKNDGDVDTAAEYGKKDRELTYGRNYNEDNSKRYGRMTVYPYCLGEPDHFQRVDAQGLHVGSSLLLDEDLEQCHSLQCSVFGAPALIPAHGFQPVEVELWTFDYKKK